MTNWPVLTDEMLRHFPSHSGNGELPSVLDPTCRTTGEGWKKSIDALLAIRELEDDWDGQGAPTPTAEVVDSAMILAVQLRRCGIRPPTTTLQGVAGEVFFEWQWPDSTTLTLEVEAPFEARLIRSTREGQLSWPELFESVAA